MVTPTGEAHSLILAKHTEGIAEGPAPSPNMPLTSVSFCPE